MTPAAIIREAQADGVMLFISSSGTIKASGDVVAVNRWAAVLREQKAGVIEALKVGVGDTATASRWWRIDFADGDSVEVSCSPPATNAEILEQHPAAVAAEPFEQIQRRPAATMTADEEAAIRAWLVQIEETDVDIVADVLKRCRSDADARGYFTGRAGGL